MGCNESLKRRGKKTPLPHLPCTSLPFRGCVSVWIVSLPWARCAGRREVLGGAAGRPPRAAGEGDAGSQEDGVPPPGKSWWWHTLKTNYCTCTLTEGTQSANAPDEDNHSNIAHILAWFQIFCPHFYVFQWFKYVQYIWKNMDKIIKIHSNNEETIQHLIRSWLFCSVETFDWERTHCIPGKVSPRLKGVKVVNVMIATASNAPNYNNAFFFIPPRAHVFHQCTK